MSIDKLPNKIIHYCWFGGNPLSDLTKKCIESWKKFLPDFEIKEWNENNFDINQCEFVKQAYEQKKWAFVSDYTRFKVLEEYGGLYLDTDMEITADIAKYLEHELFLGQEDSKLINAAVVWSREKNNPHIQNIVKSYEKKEDFNATGDLYKESVPQVLSSYFKEFGFDKEKEEIQILDDGNVHVYPMEYFYPLSYDHQHNKFTDNSCMIHHFDATWISPMEKFKTDMKRRNMKWVVYIIDFFINTKNFISTFINYKDISVFAVSFILMFLSTLALQPIEGIKEDYTFNNINIKFNVIVLFEILFSIIWTYICKKIRTIEINELLDSNLIKNKENNYRKSHINDEKKREILRYENVIFSVELILSIIFLILPLSLIINILSISNFLFSISLIFVIFMIYVGVKKKFKYRILDLLMLSIVLTILFVSNITGVIISVVMFIFTMIAIIKNGVSKKRIIVFVSSFVLFLLASIIALKFFENINYDTENLKLNINNFMDLSAIFPLENYNMTNKVVTNFNFGNGIVSKIIEVFINNNILKVIISNGVLIYLCIIFNILTCICKKNYKYGYMIIPLIMVNIINNNILECNYLNYMLVLFEISVCSISLLRIIYKNEKIKMC